MYSANLFLIRGCKIVSYGHFKIPAQECIGLGDGIDPELFVSSLYISVAIKASLLKFNVFNMYKNTLPIVYPLSTQCLSALSTESSINRLSILFTLLINSP